MTDVKETKTSKEYKVSFVQHRLDNGETKHSVIVRDKNGTRRAELDFEHGDVNVFVGERGLGSLVEIPYPRDDGEVYGQLKYWPKF